MENYWVLNKNGGKAQITIKDRVLTLCNDYIKRVINIAEGTEEILNLITNQKVAKKANADTIVIINGKRINIETQLNFKSCEWISAIDDVKYTPKEFCSETYPYPANGIGARLIYNNNEIEVEMIYEIFDWLPVICKRAYVKNISKADMALNQLILDNIGFESEMSDYFYAETNYNGGSMLNTSRKLSVHQNTKNCEIKFDTNIDITLKVGEKFEGMRVYELLHTAQYYEHKQIEIKQMYRILFPWVLESPLIFHTLTDNNRKLKKVIDDVKSVNFDMVIQSFGSGVKMECEKESYLAKKRKIYDYARSKGIKIGAYTLAIVKNYRPIYSDECNVFADPKGRIMRCLASDWSVSYWNKIFNFIDKTKADAVEIDGPYLFYQCEGGRTHLHNGIADSRYLQWKLSTVEMLKKMKERGVYVNAPDWLFLNGLNKTGIGYEEIAFSEPRQAQLLSSRIYNYLGTFGKIPSMAWSFVPIDLYHGGGKQACFSPLKKNIKDYEWTIFQHLVSGVLPCFRGRKLFDCEATKQIVTKWVNFYNKYKHIINGTTIHFMPPIIDKSNPTRAKDIDAILNVISCGETRGMLALFNQTDRKIKKKIYIPLYYTGLCKAEMLPIPHTGSHIAEVECPSYGEYPPPFPKYEGESIEKSAAVTGFGETILLKRENYPTIDRSKTGVKVAICKFDRELVVSEIDANCDAEIEVELEPMSYCWYTLKQYKI